MSLHTRSHTRTYHLLIISLSQNVTKLLTRVSIGQIKGKAIEDPSHFQAKISNSWSYLFSYLIKCEQSSINKKVYNLSYRFYITKCLICLT